MWLQPSIPSLRLLTTGLSGTLLRDVPFSAIYWTLLKVLQPEIGPLVQSLFSDPDRPQIQFGSYGLHFTQSFVAAAAAGSVAAVLTHPCDVIKTYQQVLVGSHSSPLGVCGHNVFGITTRIVANQGMMGLFAGLLPRVLKVSPACAVMISSYDVTREILA